MIILLDCDGVLADFVGHMTTEMKKCGVTLGAVVDYDFLLRDPRDNVRRLAVDLLADPETWKTIPPYEEAIDGAARFRRAGHDIVVVTSPWLSCMGWADVRREWLKKHFGVRHGDLIVTSRKELVRGDVFIDDRFSAVNAWALANEQGLALLMDRTWTKGDPSTRQRFSWSSDDIVDVLGFRP